MTPTQTPPSPSPSQAPTIDQMPAQDARFVPSQPGPAPTPPMPPVTPSQPAMPPAGWYVPPYGTQQVVPSQQQQFFRPTGAQRVGVAIASVALLIPLLAIAIGTMTSLIPYVAAGVAITGGLIAVALVCAAVVAVNIAFNFDLFRQRR